MGDAAITKIPSVNVTGAGAPVRENMKFTQTWKVPSAATDKKRNDRWEAIWITWRAVCRDRTLYSDGSVVYGDEYYFKNLAYKLGTNVTTHSWWLDRKDYYPNTGRELLYIEVEITSNNRRGAVKTPVNTKYTFSKPPAPSLSINVSSETQALACTIKNVGQEKGVTNERLTTEYRIYRQDSPGVTWNDEYVEEKLVYPKNQNDGVYTSSLDTKPEYISRHDIGIQQRIVYGKWSRIRWEAVNHGVAGDSATVRATHVHALPAIPEISFINLSDNLFPYEPTNTISIGVRPNNDNEYAPVDQIRLERLANSTAETAQEAGLASGWTEVSGMVDNGNCWGFGDTVADAVSGMEPGKHLWYRLRSTHDNRHVYSTPVEASMFYRVAVQGSQVCDVDLLFADNEKVALDISWGIEDEAEGCEISWSTDLYAWESNVPPETFKFPDSQIPEGSPPRSAVVYIKGLEFGPRYYFKVRRYSGEQYGRYTILSELYTDMFDNQFYVERPVCLTTQLPTPRLFANAPLVRGRDFSMSWEVENADHIVGLGTITQRRVRVWAAFDDEEGRCIYDEVTSDNAATIKSDLIPASATSALFSVEVGYGPIEEVTGYGDDLEDLEWSQCYNPVGGVIYDYPKPILLPDFKLTKQPLSLALASATGTESYIFTIKSKGSTAHMPYGKKVQAAGDIIYSAKVSPRWTEKEGGFITTIEFPSGIDFIDNTSYILETTVVAGNPLAKYNSGGGLYTLTAEVFADEYIGELKSQTTASTIQVAWANQALPPAAASRVVANPNSKTATIYPVRASGSATTDICDIYRVTPDGVDIIAEGVAFASSGYTDKYAPYSKGTPLSYRLASRTSDGDVEWLDIPYKLGGYSIRFDWGDDQYLEVPYNLVYSDKYSKDFEARTHLDSVRPAGFWGSTVNRTNSVSTDLVRLGDPEQIRRCRELANYPGAVFVRLPNGCAFTANVDVSGLRNDYKSLVLDVSFDITEVLPSSEFKIK